MSLFTNLTWLPRGTVMLFELTALFAIVIVGVLVPPAVGGAGVGAGAGAGDGEPPPHAVTTDASAPMTANLHSAFLHAVIMLAF